MRWLTSEVSSANRASRLSHSCVSEKSQAWCVSSVRCWPQDHQAKGVMGWYLFQFLALVRGSLQVCACVSETMHNKSWVEVVWWACLVRFSGFVEEGQLLVNRLVFLLANSAPLLDNAIKLP